MYLKSLQIAGFKSFARPVRLDLGPGITAVVGPNGSGKSNVVDAIRWVLGEQSPRALRGSRGDDVIFGGSAMRHALGMAEVIMVLDNGERRVELDVEEVAIGRRLYRSGEAEYLVNRRKARLKDVQDIAAQAGLGPSSYCVVGQGAIDQLVMQRPQERRGLIADAADTRRYELRLAEIEGDLAETQQHALRLQAVVAELRPQRDRLKTQAERAERHRAVRDEVEQLARQWFGYAVPAARAAQAAAEARCAALDAAVAAAQRRAAEIRDARAHAQASSATLKERAGALARELGQERGQREKLRVDLAASAERLEATRQRDVALGRDLMVTEQQLGLARAAYERSAQAALQAQAAITTSPGEIEALNAEVAAAEGLVATRRKLLNEAQEEADRARRQVDEIDRRLVRLREEVASAAGADAARRERAQDFSARIADLTNAIADLRAELDPDRAADGASAAALREARAEHDRAHAALRAAEQAVRQANRRLDGLVGEERAVGQLAGEPRTNDRSASRLAARLPAPLRYHRAIAAAIGEAAGFTVVDAKGVAWYVEPDGDGHSVLVPLFGVDRTGVAEFQAWVTKVLEEETPFQFALDVLDPSAEPRLAARFLGFTIIVTSIAEARVTADRLAAANEAGWPFAVATEDGQCLRASGERVLHPDSVELRAIEARSRREALAQQIAAAREAVDAAERAYQEAEEHERAAREAVRRLEEERSARRARVQRGEQRLAELSRDLQREQAGLVKLQSTVVTSPDPVAIERLTNERAQLVERAERSQLALQRLAEQLGDAERQRDGARAAHSARGAEQAVAAERAERLKDLAERDSREVQRLADRAAALRLERERVQAELATLEQRNASVQQRLSQALERIALLERDEGAARAALGDHEARLEDLAQQERAVQAELLELSNQESDARTAIEHARGELERLSVEMTAVADALAVQPDDLLGQARPAGGEALPESVDAEALQRRLARAQRDLRNLGAVDYGLLAEYARIDRRYQFLTEQLEDLAQTEASIRATMEEVRNRVRERFMAAFEDVSVRFKASFQELFQGGDADLVLTGEPGEADCAVDVVAQPPGKRLHRLVALSGGERALVGAAMLLALIGANPSPFCVLDEVDAALDEVNVQRFLHAVRGMASQTQFILVTHNRQTMEMADALFGVTMTPGAVSQILAMRLSKN